MGNIRSIMEIRAPYIPEVAATNGVETPTRPIVEETIERRAELLEELIENRISILKYGVLGLGSVSFALFHKIFYSGNPAAGAFYAASSLCLYSGIKFTLGMKKDYSLFKKNPGINISIFKILHTQFNINKLRIRCLLSNTTQFRSYFS